MNMKNNKILYLLIFMITKTNKTNLRLIIKYNIFYSTYNKSLYAQTLSVDNCLISFSFHEYINRDFVTRHVMGHLINVLIVIHFSGSDLILCTFPLWENFSLLISLTSNFSLIYHTKVKINLQHACFVDFVNN